MATPTVPNTPTHLTKEAQELLRMAAERNLTIRNRNRTARCRAGRRLLHQALELFDSYGFYTAQGTKRETDYCDFGRDQHHYISLITDGHGTIRCFKSDDWGPDPVPINVPLVYDAHDDLFYGEYDQTTGVRKEAMAVLVAAILDRINQD